MENAKMLILNNKNDNSFKAVLNLKQGSPSIIKFYNLSNLNRRLALGVKQGNNVVKVPLEIKENNSQFILPKSLNFNEKIFCAVVDVTNAFCPEIMLSGSLNSEQENTTIESAFVTTKPEDNSVLYEEEPEEELEEIIDKNLQEDATTNYYDACSNCKYRQAFYDGGKCCSSSSNSSNNAQNSVNNTQGTILSNNTTNENLVQNKQNYINETNNISGFSTLNRQNLFPQNQLKSIINNQNKMFQNNNINSMQNKNHENFYDNYSTNLNLKIQSNLDDSSNFKNNNYFDNSIEENTQSLNSEDFNLGNNINSSEIFSNKNNDFITISDTGLNSAYDEQENKNQDRNNFEQEPQNFYEQIKSQLDNLFNKYPQEEILQSLILNSKWVRVNYDNSSNYYVLGLVFDDNFEKVEYISYGMPSNDSKNPPDDIKDYAQWLPVENKGSETLGYWIVYQDANDGETIRVSFV